MTIPNLRDPAVQDRLRSFLGEGHARNLVFVGGSLVEGFGNSMSDIDIISVSERDPDVGAFPSMQEIGAAHAIEISAFEGTRVDAEIISRSNVEGIIDSVESGARHPGSIGPTETTLLNNLFVGIPLFNVNQSALWRDGLNWASWRRTLFRACNTRYRGSSEDAQGAIEGGNHWVAFYSSLHALDASADALLIAAGSMSVRGKWRMNYFSKFGMDEQSREYWGLVARSGDTPGEVIRIAKRRLMVAQRWMHDAGVTVSE